MLLESYALSDKGCVRANNEDSYLVEPDLGLYVLADGMGGAAAGEHASRLAVEAVSETILFASRRDEQVLLRAVEEANHRVLKAAQQDPRLEGMGTTLVAALAVGEEVFIASVGDSRVYLFDDDGFRAVTEDQTWVNEVGRPLGIDEESLRTHPMRHVLTMAIGASSPLTVNYYKVSLTDRALLLMCTDGLHGVVDSSLIEATVRQARDGTPLSTICEELVEAANAAGGPDNITTVLVRKTS